MKFLTKKFSSSFFTCDISYPFTPPVIQYGANALRKPSCRLRAGPKFIFSLFLLRQPACCQPRKDCPARSSLFRRGREGKLRNNLGGGCGALGHTDYSTLFFTTQISFIHGCFRIKRQISRTGGRELISRWVALVACVILLLERENGEGELYSNSSVVLAFLFVLNFVSVGNFVCFVVLRAGTKSWRTAGYKPAFPASIYVFEK